MCKKWAGSLQIGLTAVPLTDDVTSTTLPASLSQLSPDVTWFVTRSEVWHNGKKICENYCPSLDRVNVDDVIGIKRSSTGAMHLCVNGHDMGPSASNLPQVYIAFTTSALNSFHFIFACRNLLIYFLSILETSSLWRLTVVLVTSAFIEIVAYS